MKKSELDKNDRDEDEPDESHESCANPQRKRVARILVRIAFAVVFAVNVQCAVSFVLWPGAYAPAYELSGTAGEAAVQGLGIAFLMWNATYPAVIVDPRRFRALGVVVLAQQVIGLAGESWMLLSLPDGHAPLAESIGRFIAFDGFGLVLMATAFIWMLWTERSAGQ